MYFVITIEDAYKNALKTGSKFLYSNSEKFGFRTTYTPINPNTIADHLLIPINSFKKNFANIETKKGLEKNNAFAVARGIKVKDIKNAEKARKCRTTLKIVKKKVSLKTQYPFLTILRVVLHFLAFSAFFISLTFMDIEDKKLKV